MGLEQDSISVLTDDREIIEDLLEKYLQTLNDIDEDKETFIFENMIQNIVMNLRQIKLNLAALIKIYEVLIAEKRDDANGFNNKRPN